MTFSLTLNKVVLSRGRDRAAVERPKVTLLATGVLLLIPPELPFLLIFTLLSFNKLPGFLLSYPHIDNDGGDN